jgi:hypothetical protein
MSGPDPTVKRLHGYLRAIEQQYPGLWRTVDEMRAERRRTLPDWPRWCFMPLAGAYAIASGGRDVPPEQLTGVGVIGCLAAWRPTQGIYRYDPSVLEAIWDTPLTGDIPTEVLHGLPEWCVYVELPPAGEFYRLHPWQAEGAVGFFAWLESDANSGREELRLALDRGGAGLAVMMPIHLDRGGLLEGLESAKAEAARQAQRYATTDEQQRILALPSDDIGVLLAPLVNLVLYLCSDDPELRDSSGHTRPHRPAATPALARPFVLPRHRRNIRRAVARMRGRVRTFAAHTGMATGRAHVPSRQRSASSCCVGWRQFRSM